MNFKWLENSKWAVVCCSDEEVGCAIVSQRVKIVFQPLLSSINWEFSSSCALTSFLPIERFEWLYYLLETRHINSFHTFTIIRYLLHNVNCKEFGCLLMCLLGSGGQFDFTVVPLSLFLDLPRSLHKESRHPDCLLSRPMRWGWESKHCYTGWSISNSLSLFSPWF